MDMSVQVQRCLYANPFESFRSNKQGFWGFFLAAAISEENMRMMDATIVYMHKTSVCVDVA
jgi:hypothetical protein